MPTILGWEPQARVTSRGVSTERSPTIVQVALALDSTAPGTMEIEPRFIDIVTLRHEPGLARPGCQSHSVEPRGISAHSRDAISVAAASTTRASLVLTADGLTSRRGSQMDAPPSPRIRHGQDPSPNAVHSPAHHVVHFCSFDTVPDGDR
jgi:hypothetical protein